MISILYEKITRIPDYPEGITEVSLLKYSWDSNSESVRLFKEHLKERLRHVQYGRCAFCRRNLGDIRDTHLEHFIEKFVYPQFSFAIKNITLSCSTCNGRKEQVRRKLFRMLKTRAIRHSRDPGSIKLAPGVIGILNTEIPASYRWVHPYYDNYSENICIKRNWIYAPNSRKGSRTIRSLRLNELATMEKTARRERLISKGGMISLLGTALFSELGNATPREIFDDLVHAIKEKRFIDSVLRDIKKFKNGSGLFPKDYLLLGYSSDENENPTAADNNGVTEKLVLLPPPNKNNSSAS